MNGIVSAYRNSHQNDQTSGHILHCRSFASPWRPPGQYGASICPMAMFSGFNESPGPPLLCDACGIVPLHHHGFRNGQQQRYVCLLSPPLSFDQNIAKRPCYGSFKLTPSYYIDLIGVISLFVSYLLPLKTMAGVSATIVAGGRARFQEIIEASKKIN